MEIIISLLGLFLLAIGIAGLVLSFFWPAKEFEVRDPETRGYKTVKSTLPGKNLARIGGPIAFIFGVLLLGLRIIPAGYVGVVLHAGAVDPNEKAPGINWVLPFVDNIENFETRVQAVPFEQLAAASKEYQDVFLTGVVNYHIDNTAAAELYQNVGRDYREKLIIPFYANIVKEIVPQFGVAEVLPQRGEIRRLTVERLVAKLGPYGIIVDDVALANVDFNEDYNAAIQDKQIQELRIATERNILEQKRIQAEQAVAEAEGQANAQIERARGEAEANRQIAESLNETLLTYQYISKLSPSIRTILIPNGEQIILPPEIVSGQEAPEATPAPEPTTAP
jgi:regulator of protease activity HflC (stomatin/prohibitin superfamily)